jgi:adenylosuccinate lyase
VIPQAFLAVDAILILLENIATGMVVYPQVIRKNLREELPFMATENILMSAVEQGGDRQDLHERIRQHSIAAGAVVKNEGLPNDLLERMQQDTAFQGLDMQELLDEQQYIGRSAEQVREFLAEIIEPLLQRYPQEHGLESEVKV